MYPSSSWNSGPATMYSFSLVNASRYAFPISAPHSSRLLSLPRKITSLRFKGKYHVYFSVTPLLRSQYTNNI